MKEQDNTEQRIKETARKLFQEKGFDAVRTREIAEAAGINSALLHYYFRTKEKLFRIIMTESYQEMFSFIEGCINDRSTSLPEKIEAMVSGFTNVIQANPNLAIFVFNELHSNPSLLFKELGIPQNFIYDSHLYTQLEEQIRKKSLPMAPQQIVINLISLSVMPIIAKPMLAYLYYPKIEDINEFLNERRKLIPMWIKQMFQIEE